jgi:hypothetical protein
MPPPDHHPAHGVATTSLYTTTWAAGLEVAAEDLNIIGGISTARTAATGLETCSDHGIVSLKCGGSAAATFASGASAVLAKRAASRPAKSAWYAAGTAWGYVSHWIGAS